MPLNLGLLLLVGLVQAVDLTTLYRFETEGERRIRKVRQEEISETELALGLRKKEKRNPELYLRLTELYYEAYQTAFLLEGRYHDKRIQTGEKPKNVDRTGSIPLLRKAMQMGKELVEMGQGYPRLDRAYLFLGQAHLEMGEVSKAQEYWEELLRKFPETPLSAEVYSQVGDLHYDRKAYREAKDYYLKSQKKGQTDTYPRLLYRLAWCEYRLRNTDEAIRVLKQAIEQSQKQGEKYLSLQDEALRDLAVFLVEKGQTEEALDYFKNATHSATQYSKVVEKMGAELERRGGTSKAQAVRMYEEVVQTSPQTEAALRSAIRLIELDIAQGKDDRVAKRLEQFPLPDRAYPETEAPLQNLRALIRRTATQSHERYQKGLKLEDARRAKQYYQMYVGHFLKWSDPRGELPEISLYLAELEDDLGHPDQASAYYEQVSANKDRKLSKEASLLHLKSLSRQLKKQADSAGSKKNKTPTALERKYVQVVDRLGEIDPNAPEVKEGRLQVAQMLAGYSEEQTEAFRRARDVYALYDPSPQAATAAALAFQILGDRLPTVAQAEKGESLEAAEDLQEFAKGFREKHPVLAKNPVVEKKWTALQSRLQALLIRQSELQGKTSEVAQQYEEVAKKQTDPKLRDASLEKALLAYAKVHDREGVKRVAGSLLARSFKDGQGERIRRIATLFFIQGGFRDAADLFLELGTSSKVASEQVAALSLAVTLYEGLDLIDRREEAFQAWIQRSSPAEKSRLFLKRGLIFERRGQSREAYVSFEQCMNSKKVPAGLVWECAMRAGDIWYRTQSDTEVQKFYERILRNLPKAPNRWIEAAAYYRIALTKISEEETIELHLPEADLKRSIERRLKLVENRSRLFQQVLTRGGPWAIAALHQMALPVYALALDLDHLAASPEVAARPQAEAVRNSLLGLSKNLKTKAQESWKKALQRANDESLLSPVNGEILNHLDTLKTSGMGLAQGFQGRFRLMGLAPDGGEEGSEKALQRVRATLEQKTEDAQAWIDYGNLLWGQGKVRFAEICFERAQDLASTRSGNGGNLQAVAINNRAALLGSSIWVMENWVNAFQVLDLIREAQKKDRFSAMAKANEGILLNYYSLFKKSKPLWDRIEERRMVPELKEGWAIAVQGNGATSEAKSLWKELDSKLGERSQFSLLFHKAALAAGTESERDQCADALDGLSEDRLEGFERAAYTRLKRRCSP